MSYFNMDHAGWVQRNIAAYKKHKPTAADRRSAAEHKGWFAAPDELNPFQRRAFDILGIVGGGIYNAPIAWRSIVWHPRFIIVKWRNNLATWDFCQLTRFVFLCHEARIRGGIAASMRELEVALHERVAEGPISLRHPNLDEAVAAWREEFPATHSIIYSGPAKQYSVPQFAADLMNPGADVASVSAIASGDTLEANL